MKHALSALGLSLVLLVPALASAQELGSKGDAIFSADRLMGVTGTHHVTEIEPNDVENDFTSISFGWRGAPGTSPFDTSPFDVPRFSFDYVIFDHFSIGGSLGYLAINPDRGNDASALLLAPRVGYAYAFGRVVGIWARGGFTYHTLNVDNNFEQSGLALTLECPFTFSPAQHFAFSVGPTFDIDMFGETDPAGNGPDFDERWRAFGLNAGLLGWF